MVDGEKIDVTFDPKFAVEFVDTDGNGIADRMQWMVPKLSEEQFVIEAKITIINIQSFPFVGGNWTVRFTTEGTADLVISGFNGTTFGEAAPEDLKFLELNNGTHTLTPTIQGNSIIYSNYSSNAEGFEASKVLTLGAHTLEFRFGDDVQYAFNVAGSLDQCKNGQLPSTNPCSGADWVSGNVGSQNSHFVEGESIPYRAIITGLSSSTAHTVVIGFE